MPTNTVYLLNLSKSYEYFQQKQEELRTYQAQLKIIKHVFFYLLFFSIFYIYSFSFQKLEFTPSTFKFTKEQFGELRKDRLWLDISLILTKEEIMILSQMIDSKDCVLLYRATRDGFEGASFHSKCDGEAKTITIIKTKDNYVFGGYTAVTWGSSNNYKTDAAAYIYSLRRNGVSNLSKHNISDCQHAVYNRPLFGPTFGGGHDLHICDRSDVTKGSYTKSDGTYYRGIPSNKYLAGTYNSWLTDEIEVFQIL
jgi:hypothetical protein